jgi:hypothetical protein
VNIASLIAASSLAAPVRMVRLIIAGSRDLPSHPTLDDIHDAIDRMLVEYDIVPIEVVSGCARGVDRAGEQWAEAVGLPVKRFPVKPSDWRTYGKFAGPRRNNEMSVYGDALLAFHDGKSRGTADMIQQMRDRKKPVRVVKL